jgi:DNA repair protein RadA/Sms
MIEMPKSYSRYVCQQCGRVSAGPMGRCPQCGSFNSMVEEIVQDTPPAKSPNAARGLTGRTSPRRIGDVSSDAEDRVAVPITEFSRVLGGGIVPGSIVLVGGDPGIGKSTLMLQMALAMASKMRVLYVSGEESERQIKMRADRLMEKGDKFPQDLYLVTETNLPTILEHNREVQPGLLIIDSIQTVYRTGLFRRVSLASA